MEANSSDEDWSDAEEGNPHGEAQTLCLFCKETYDDAVICLGHITQAHNFDLIGFCKSNNIDFYGFIRLINFIRGKRINEKQIKTVQKSEFDDEEYLKPILVDDGMLQADFEGLLENYCSVNGGNYNGAPTEDEEKKSLQEKLKETERRALFAEEQLARAVNDLQKCKQEIQNLLHHGHDEVGQNVKVSDESKAYFESYAHHGIHEEMLKDKVRTEAYRDFILSNGDVFKDKVVLDVGCGTGILSMFAAKSGARLVLAVDQSDIAYQAMDIIRENNLHHVVKVIKGNAEKIVLPDGVKKVDIIISEWMGYFLLFESMLDSILRCRDKFLSKNGSLFPDQCNMFLAAICDTETWESKIGFWDNVYGHRMSCMKRYVKEEPLIEVVKEGAVISNPAKIAAFDITNVKVKELDFETDFSLDVIKSGYCTGIVGYFDVHFAKNVTDPIVFSTGCDAVPTHWKQTVFLSDDKVAVAQGEKLNGRISCKKDSKDARALLVDLTLNKENGNVIIQKTYSLK